jgi:sulfur-oxidizing protein SoxY
MNQHRRNLLKQATVFGLMASAGLITSAQAQEWSKAAFEGKTWMKCLKP